MVSHVSSLAYKTKFLVTNGNKFVIKWLQISDDMGYNVLFRKSFLPPYLLKVIEKQSIVRRKLTNKIRRLYYFAVSYLTNRF